MGIKHSDGDFYEEESGSMVLHFLKEAGNALQFLSASGGSRGYKIDEAGDEYDLECEHCGSPMYYNGFNYICTGCGMEADESDLEEDGIEIGHE